MGPEQVCQMVFVVEIRLRTPTILLCPVGEANKRVLRELQKIPEQWKSWRSRRHLLLDTFIAKYVENKLEGTDQYAEQHYDRD